MEAQKAGKSGAALESKGDSKGSAPASAAAASPLHEAAAQGDLHVVTFCVDKCQVCCLCAFARFGPTLRAYGHERSLVCSSFARSLVTGGRALRLLAEYDRVCLLVACRWTRTL